MLDEVVIDRVENLINIPESEIVSKECRFATYCEPGDYNTPDLHVIKEVIHTKDGKSHNNLRFEYNRTRPFWITKKGFRNHKQTKENELVERLQRFNSTQAKLNLAISRVLNASHLANNKRKLYECPYIFGVDITSTAVIKKAYKDKYKKNTAYSVCELDIETNMFTEEGEPLMCTISMKEKLLTVICKDYLKGYINPLEEIDNLTMKYLGEHVTKRNIKLESQIVDDPMQMWEVIFAKAHEWKPDFLSIWNITFEMNKFLETCDRHGKDPKFIVCDPSVPDEYKHFSYVEGKKIKIMASGKSMPIRPAARWHKVIAPASFVMIDQMCVYKQTRSGTAEEPSYSLEFLLQKELGLGKLKFEEADHLVPASAEWHMFMQKNYPLHYVVYNRFDTIGPELLDEKVKDLSFVMPSMADTSDFDRFNSQPRRSVEKIHWFLMEQKGRIMGVTSNAIVDEYDEETLSRQDLIITLPAALISEQGLPVVKEYGTAGAYTKIYKDVADLDVSASYPNGEVACNTSKATTIREIISIEGIPEKVFKLQNMGLSGGHVNSVDYCVTMMGYPSHAELLAGFIAQTGATEKVTIEQAKEDARQYA